MGPDGSEGESRERAAAGITEMISEELQHLDRSAASKGSHGAAKAAEDHAETQVHRAVTISNYEQVLDATLRNLDFDHLLPEILGRIRAMMDVDAATLFLVGADGLSLQAAASVGLEASDERAIRIPLGGGLVGAAFAERQSKVLDHVTAETVANPVLFEMGIRALAAVPIFVGNDPVGALTVGSKGHRGFQNSEIRLLEVVAERVGYAIERNRILDQANRERERAEKASRFKTTLLHMASHDLKTPLTVIRLELRTLSRKGLTDEEKARTLGVLDRNITRLGLTLDDFLDVARIEAGRFTLQRHQLDLRGLADEVVAMFRVQADSKHLGFEVKGSSVLLDADERRMFQVVVNLVSNALRYTASGSVSLKVECIGVGPQTSSAVARLTVRDTGLGMTQQQLADLFTPFGQVHDGPQEGAGLGLYLSKVIVEAHGGTIVVESHGPGLGTTVTVEIPLVAPVAPPSNEGESQPPSYATPRP